MIVGAFLKTTVSTSGSGYGAYSIEPSEVHNLGLITTKLTVLIISAAVTASGAAFASRR